MEFLLLGYDGKDEAAISRRMAARPAHLEGVQRLHAEGKLSYAAALIDEAEKMIGSCMVLSFSSRQELDSWLKDEPYVLGEVWQQIEISPCKTAAVFAK